MCERVEWGDSGTGVSVKKEREERSHSGLGGHNRVWSGKTWVWEGRREKMDNWMQKDWGLESEDKEGG